MYDLCVWHKVERVSVFYGTFGSLQEAQEAASFLSIDSETEEITITLCVILT